MEPRLPIPGLLTYRKPAASLVGRRVFVYRNLHHGGWSLRATGGQLRGRVLGHAEIVTLRDCEFSVAARGRARVRRTRRKNVHAGVTGTITSLGERFQLPKGCVRVFYDPYVVDGFRADGPWGHPLETARAVFAGPRHIWALE